MDFSSQRCSEDINIPLVINKLLLQQKGDREKNQEKYYPFISRHIKCKTLPEIELTQRNDAYKSDYSKMKRALYDHTKSLRHCDCSFSIGTVLAAQREKPISSKSHTRSKSKSIKLRSKFHEVFNKTEKILENNLNILPRSENQDNSPRKLFTKQSRNHPRVRVNIPSIRAHTILPSPRKPPASNMVDQEVLTDNHSFFPYML